MISEEAFSSGVTLGYNDAICSSLTDGTDAFDEANLDGGNTLSDIEKSIYSYNHAIERLNSVCASLITDTSKIAKDNNNNYKIRSVGSNPDDPNSENVTLFTSTFIAANPQDNDTYAEGYLDNIVKSSDTNYVTDFDRLIQLGKVKATNEYDYWLASRFIDENSNRIRFKIRYVRQGAGDTEYLCTVSKSDIQENGSTNYVRPVVTLDSTLCTFQYNDADGGYFTIE